MIPKDGAYRSPAHDYWFNGEGPLPGGTRPGGELEKGAVINWAKTEAARCAVRNLDIIGDLIARGGEEAAVKWIASLPDYQRDQAADLGSSVHTMAEQIARGGDLTVGELEAPYIGRIGTSSSVRSRPASGSNGWSSTSRWATPGP
jgi:hypothetical protein